MQNYAGDGDFMELVSRGEDLINEWIRSHKEESLHLEFKQLGGVSNGQFEGQTRDIVARALSGMSNAEGGLILFGVSPRSKNQIDVIGGLSPISNVTIIAAKIQAGIASLVQPEPRGILVKPILASAGNGSGYIALFCPSSDDRPHMAVSTNREFRYYRRGSQGNSPMGPREVRDLMLMQKQATIVTRLRPTNRYGPKEDGRERFTFTVNLKNDGKIAASAPFVKLFIDGHAPHMADYRAPDAGHIITRSFSSGHIGFYTASSYLIHADDEVDFCSVDFNLYKLASGYSIRRDMHVQVIDFDVIFGAENCPAARVRRQLSAQELVDSYMRASAFRFQ
jgi:hypothetical protein